VTGLRGVELGAGQEHEDMGVVEERPAGQEDLPVREQTCAPSAVYDVVYEADQHLPR
jgi:hypothetical protein